MIMKKLLCAACAAVTAVSCLAFSAAADAEEKKVIPFTFDKSLTTSESAAPTVSFDGDDWVKYVHTTSDSGKIGLNITLDKSTYYQGFSLKANCSSSQNSELFQNAGAVTDADNNPVYPAASEEGASFISPGVELRAEDFGLSCFDGCLVTFRYKIGNDCQGKLMGDSVYAFGTDDTYVPVFSMLQLKYDTVLNNNVTQYLPQAISIPAEAAVTRIVFEIPLLEKTDCDVLCLDNISIQLPDSGDSKGLYIKNLDGFNAKANPQETISEIQIKEKKESTAEIGSTPEKQEGGHGFIVAIVIIVIVAAGGVGTFFFIKKKKQYY